MTKPKALLINVIWLSALLIGGNYILGWFNRDELGFLKNPNRVLLTTEMSIEGKIVKFLSDRGASYVKLDNSKNITIKHSRNYDYDEPWLNDFLQEGDFLFKKENSDTLWIGRGENTFYFVIGQFVNEM